MFQVLVQYDYVSQNSFGTNSCNFKISIFHPMSCFDYLSHSFFMLFCNQIILVNQFSGFLQACKSFFCQYKPENSNQHKRNEDKYTEWTNSFITTLATQAIPSPLTHKMIPQKNAHYIKIPPGLRFICKIQLVLIYYLNLV